MRPIVVVPPIIIAWTLLAVFAACMAFVFLLFTLRNPKRNRALVLYWSLAAIGCTALAGLGGFVWRQEATREPTPAEAAAWTKEAEVELKKRQESLKAAVDRAHEVNQKVIREYEAEQRAKGGK